MNDYICCDSASMLWKIDEDAFDHVPKQGNSDADFG
jgi:hypothetical protein